MTTALRVVHVTNSEQLPGVSCPPRVLRLAPMYRAPRFSLPAVSQAVLPGLGGAEKIRLWSAIPFGYRRARRATWRRHLEQHPAIAALRADGQRNLMAILWVLAIHADDATGRTRPTWQRIMDGTGLSYSTVAKHLRWAREHDLIGHVEHGSTERFRAGQDPDQVGNRAAVYVLLMPEPISRTPSGLRPSVLNPPRPRAHVEQDEPDKPAAQGAAGGSYDDLMEVKTRRQRLAAAEELQRRVPVARGRVERVAGFGRADPVAATEQHPMQG